MMETMMRTAARAQPRRRTIAVFASSSAGPLAIYEEAAYEVGTLLADLLVQLLIEGGSSSGVLGAFVAPVLAAGLPVVQVVAGYASRHFDASRHRWVRDRQQGLQWMLAQADALLVLPGGREAQGTLWQVLLARQTVRPLLAICNTAHCFQPVLAWLPRLAGGQQGMWWSEQPRTLVIPLRTQVVWPASTGKDGTVWYV